MRRASAGYYAVHRRGILGYYPACRSRANQGAALQIFVGASGSCMRPELEEALNILTRELPEIIERDGITMLNSLVIST